MYSHTPTTLDMIHFIMFNSVMAICGGIALACFSGQNINKRVELNELDVSVLPVLLLLWRCERIMFWILTSKQFASKLLYSIDYTAMLIIFEIIMLNCPCRKHVILRTSCNSSMTRLYDRLNVLRRHASNSWSIFWQSPLYEMQYKNDQFFKFYCTIRCTMLFTTTLSKIFQIGTKIGIFSLINQHALRANFITWLCLLFVVYGAKSRSSLVLQCCLFKCVSPNFRKEKLNTESKEFFEKMDFLARFHGILFFNTVIRCILSLIQRLGIFLCTYYAIFMRLRDTKHLELCSELFTVFIMIILYMLPNG